MCVCYLYIVYIPIKSDSEQNFTGIINTATCRDARVRKLTWIHRNLARENDFLSYVYFCVWADCSVCPSVRVCVGICKCAPECFIRTVLIKWCFTRPRPGNTHPWYRHHIRNTAISVSSTLNSVNYMLNISFLFPMPISMTLFIGPFFYSQKK